MITITIPGPPVAKQRARVGKGGRVYTPPETRSYEQKVAVFATVAARRAKWKVTSEPVEIDVRIYRARATGDLSNFVKAIEDGMNGIIYVDDRQIVSIDAAMFLDRKNPRTEVKVRLASELKETGTY